jgi:hypothetical protein
MNTSTMKSLNNARRASAGLSPTNTGSGMGSRSGSNASLASKNTNGTTYSYERLENQPGYEGSKSPRSGVLGLYNRLFKPDVRNPLGGGRRRSRKVRKTRKHKTRRSRK